MNQKVDDLTGKLAKIDGYRMMFNAAFPGQGITLANVAKAIATFERTVVSPIAPFDRWVAGDESAISESAKRGFATFNDKANCVACHSGWNFTDGSFHDIGLPDKDIGRGKHLNLQKMQHAFKTPTLRDADRRGPYMHNGSITTLADVVEHYNKGGTQRPSLSDDMKPLNLTAQEKADLVEFMLTLTSEPTTARHPSLPVASQRTDVKSR
jgi:cytochrome c peroxidase